METFFKGLPLESFTSQITPLNAIIIYSRITRQDTAQYTPNHKYTITTFQIKFIANSFIMFTEIPFQIISGLRGGTKLNNLRKLLENENLYELCSC